MAFRYLDGQGSEVTAADRRALDLQIRLGNITPSTLILDEDREEWVRADRHPAYMELVEGASGDGNRPTESAVGAPSTSSITFEPYDVDMAKAKSHVAQPERMESSAPPESARATRTRSADPAPVAARPLPSSGNVPRIRRVASRRAVWRPYLRRWVAGLVAPLLALLAVLLLSGGVSRASSLSAPAVVIRVPVDSGLGDPPEPSRRGLEKSGRRFRARAAELSQEMELPAAPPGIWLDGAYLAHAGRYPEVLEYWDGFRGLVRELSREDMQLYRSGLEDYLRDSKLGDAERARAWLWAVRAFEERRPQRRAVYADFEELAAAAIELHVLLLRRAGEIEHQPVRGRTMSRAPVLEAVPRDDAVKAELDGVLDRVLNTLSRVHGLEPVSTDRLTERLLQRLESTIMP